MQAVLEKYEGRFNIIALSPTGGEISPGGDYDFIFGHSAQADRLYDVRSIPHTIFIDAEGRIAEEHRGSMSEEAFEAAVKSLFAKIPNV